MADTRCPSFALCDSTENSQSSFGSFGGTTGFWPFAEHMRQFHSDWQIPVLKENAHLLRLHKTYEEIWNIIGHDLCKHHGMCPCSYPQSLEPMKETSVLQIALILDTTESMRKHIKQCQQDLGKLMKNVQDNVNKRGINPKVELAFVGYKDTYADGRSDPGHLVSLDFTGNYADVMQVINTQSAYGGGDQPEDIAGAFRKALDLSWKEGACKAIALIADMPCHGSDYNDMRRYWAPGSFLDSSKYGMEHAYHMLASCNGRHNFDEGDYDNFEGHIHEMDTALRDMYDRGVNLLFFAITESTQKMEHRFEEQFRTFRESSDSLGPCFRPRLMLFS